MYKSRKKFASTQWQLAVLLIAGMLPGFQVRLGAQWVATWGDAPAGAPPHSTVTYSNQTRRLIVHPSVSGSQVRVKFSNVFGNVPLTLGEVHIAQSGIGSEIIQATDTKLTFSRQSSVTIPPGQEVVSDPANFQVKTLSDLSISYYLPAPTLPTTTHVTSFQNNWVEVGNNVSSKAMPFALDYPWWDFMTQVQVAQGLSALATVVAFGDSITDGVKSTFNADKRWPDDLARLLQSKGLNYGVVNAGISGNRLLHDSAVANLYGASGLSRFDRDVLQVAGARYVVVLLGINDIGQPGEAAPASDLVSAGDLEIGYFLLSLSAHSNGLQIFLGTLTPFGGSDFYSASKEQERQEVNGWIRNASWFGLFDGIIDFDAAVRDRNDPTKLSSVADSGDHLHLSDAGYQIMGVTAYSALLNGGSDDREF